MIYSILIVLILLLLAFQDWKERKVSWLWFIPLTILFFLIRYGEIDIENQLITIGLNLCYIAFQMGMIWFYFFVKTKEKKNIINTYFGLGDLLLLAVFAFAFSLPNYVVFLMAGMLFSIVIHLILKPLFNLKNNSVPLVTYFSIFFILLYFIEKQHLISSFYGNWIRSLIEYV